VQVIPRNLERGDNDGRISNQDVITQERHFTFIFSTITMALADYRGRIKGDLQGVRLILYVVLVSELFAWWELMMENFQS
jgi:hypothetical protein